MGAFRYTTIDCIKRWKWYPRVTAPEIVTLIPECVRMGFTALPLIVSGPMPAAAPRPAPYASWGGWGRDAQDLAPYSTPYGSTDNGGHGGNLGGAGVSGGVRGGGGGADNRHGGQPVDEQGPRPGVIAPILDAVAVVIPVASLLPLLPSPDLLPVLDLIPVLVPGILPILPELLLPVITPTDVPAPGWLAILPALLALAWSRRRRA